MSEQPLRTLMRGLRKAADPAEVGGLTDSELLRRWVAHRDAAAFEVLVWRHGPAILGLCRRLLRDGHAAEDAFQAAFLALALKAASISRGEAIASWLYKVAYRAALRLRAGTCHWQALDPEAADPEATDPTGTADRRDLRAALDEELDRLPARYRAPLVLCYFEGRTNEEAARELGCPVGTVVSRLARGRQRLRGRLLRRGLTPAVALLAGTLPREAVALPAALVAATARAVLPAAVGSEAVVSAQVMALTEGVLRTMSMTKLKIVMAVLMTGTVAGVAAVGYQGAGDGPAAKAVPSRRAVTQRPLGGKRTSPAVLQDLRDAVETAKATVAIKRANLTAAEAALRFARNQLKRMQQLAKVGAVDNTLVEEKEANAAAKEAALQSAKAEVQLAEIVLKQALLRLETGGARKAETPMPPRALSLPQRLQQLEKQLDTMRREIDSIKRQLREKQEQ